MSRQPRETFTCPHCGDRCDHTVTPLVDDATPSGFTLSKVCHGSCAETTAVLTAEAVVRLTGQSYDGTTGRWTHLPESSVVGWGRVAAGGSEPAPRYRAAFKVPARRPMSRR